MTITDCYDRGGLAVRLQQAVTPPPVRVRLVPQRIMLLLLCWLGSQSPAKTTAVPPILELDLLLFPSKVPALGSGCVWIQSPVRLGANVRRIQSLFPNRQLLPKN